ncbi:MAG: leucine-rich repeat protein [Firmicutes bacterium]|nr:leucine-rich repeat protein [Bacillota bacterium]
MGINNSLLSKYFMRKDRNVADVNLDRKGNKLTLREILTALGEEVPEKFDDIADEPQRIAFRPQNVKPGYVCLVIRAAEDAGFHTFTSKDQYDIAIANGAKLIIMGREQFKGAGLKEEDFPVILVPRLRGKIFKFMYLLRERQQGKVVTITGSIGKTTTKDFCACVAGGQFETYSSYKNSNTIHALARHLLNEKNKHYDVYIQETGAGYPGSVKYASRVMRPDYFIVTNVLNHHMQAYGSFERLFKDKVSGDLFLADDGKVIVNYDDKNLKKHRFKHDVISFGIENEDVDYRGINIRQDGSVLRFDVFEKETGKTTPISIEIYGEHNVYNALAAFALGRCLGIEEDNIAEYLKEYETGGVRQKLVNVGGVYVDMDCYNVAEESILSMLKIGENFELKKGGRKIALLGGENKLGLDLHERSEAFGERLAEVAFDQFIFVGRFDDDELALKRYGNAKDIYKGFNKKSDKPNVYLTSIDEVTEYLRGTIKRGDLLMVKGIFLLDFPISVDKVMGTSFSYNLSNYKKSMEKKKADGIDFDVIPELGEAEILNSKITKGLVKVPSRLEGFPVFRIGAGAFRAREGLKKINFENGLKNIGEEAFLECPNLTAIKLPGSVKVIEDKAFMGCTALKEVSLKPGITHIGDDAFKGCESLCSINIPRSVGYIGESAFEGVGDLIVRCRKGSYAARYAKRNGLKTEFIE